MQVPTEINAEGIKSVCIYEYKDLLLNQYYLYVFAIILFLLFFNVKKKKLFLTFLWLQFKDFIMSYNKLSEICFIDCITDFTTRDVKSKEEKCALNCMEKYLKMNQRVSQRFQEFQMIANENVLAAEKKLGRN